MPDVFTELERDWGAFSRSKAGAAALARWGLTESSLVAFDDLGCLAIAAQGGGVVDLDHRDQLQFALLRCARHDRDARYTLLAILRPGLGRLARRSCAQWGFEETAAATVDLALEAIIAYPEGRARPATCILRHVRVHDMLVRA